MANYTIDKNISLTLNVNDVINNGSNGFWKIVGTSLVHDNTRESYIDKTYSFLTEGKTYRITYNATHTSCSYRMYLGDTQGTLFNNSGSKVETLVYTGTSKKIRFWSNGGVSINNIKVEELQLVVEDQIVELDDDFIQNKSFTLSYNPIAKQWISFHSYLPNNYIIHPNSLLTKSNESQIKQFNKGNYGQYFDSSIKSFIIETIFNEFPTETKVYDNITVNLKSSTDNNRLEVPSNKFFDSIVLNTEYQCSGEIILNLSNLTKKERNWCINKFNDITNNLPTSLFTNEWSEISSKYPIDKIVNNDKIDINKPWYQRGRFRDKFLQVRFIENNLINQKIIVNFVSTIYRASQR